MLNHIDSREAHHIAKKMAVWNIRLMMAKGLFWVGAAAALLLWAIKS